MAEWLCRRADAAGRVVATDLQTKFLAAIGAPKIDGGLASAVEAGQYLADIQSPDFHAIASIHFAASDRRP